MLSYGAFLSSSAVAQYGFLMDPPAVLAVWPQSRFLPDDTEEMTSPDLEVAQRAKKKLDFEQMKGSLAAEQNCYNKAPAFVEIAAAAAVPGGDKVHFEKMLECERIWALSLEFVTENDLTKLDFREAFDMENELSALGSMKGYLLQWITQHGSSVEEDEALLQDPSLVYKHILLVKLRLAEKKYFRNMIEEIQMREDSIGQALKVEEDASKEGGSADL